MVYFPTSDTRRGIDFACVCSREGAGNEQDGKELQSLRKRSLAPHRSLVHMRINLVPVFEVNTDKRSETKNDGRKIWKYGAQSDREINDAGR